MGPKVRSSAHVWMSEGPRQGRTKVAEAVKRMSPDMSPARGRVPLVCPRCYPPIGGAGKPGQHFCSCIQTSPDPLRFAVLSVGRSRNGRLRDACDVGGDGLMVTLCLSRG